MLNFKNLSKIILFYSVLALLGIVWIQWGNLEVRFFGTSGIFLATAIGFMVFILSNIITQKMSWAQKLEQLFVKLLTPMSLPMIMTLSLFSAIGEEIFFRGAIQNQFGIIASSLLFGLVHFPIEKTMIPWTLSATIMGFVLGGLYLYAGHLLAPITLHFVINGLNLWAIDQKNRQKSRS